MERKTRAASSVLVQIPTDIHSIEWNDLMPILKDYPVFREEFLEKMMLSFQIGDYVRVRF